MKNPRTLLAALVAAVVLFLWQSFAHMALPWSHSAMGPFEDAATIERTLKDNVLADGIYMLPHAAPGHQEAWEAAHRQATEGFSVLAIVTLSGKKSFGECLAWQFLFNLIGALLVTFLLTKLSHDGMGCRMGVTVFFSLFTAATAILPNWAWFAYPNSYTSFAVFTHVIGWTLAGLVLAKMIPKNEAADSDSTAPAAEEEVVD